MIKVLNLIQCLNLGGMEQCAYALMEATHGQTIDWTVQSVTPVGEGIERLSRIKVASEGNEYIGRFGWRSHPLLKKNIAKFEGDIILLTGPTLTSCAAVKHHQSKKILGIHFVHGTRAQDLMKWKVFYRLFGNDYDAILYHSQHILEEAINLAPNLKHKFHLVNYATTNCFIPSQEQKEYARKTLGIPQDSFVIGNAGWLIPRKRFDIFLKTCQHIKTKCDRVRFVIAGDGALRSELETLAASLHISEAVIFLGWQQDLDIFYKSLDILLFNSDSDAFGRTVMEAMGYGVPAVASVVEGGPKSILKHGENGFILDTHDTSTLSEHCLSLIKNQALYRDFQRRSIETITQQCSQTKYVESYMSIFKKVLTTSVC